MGKYELLKQNIKHLTCVVFLFASLVRNVVRSDKEKNGYKLVDGFESFGLSKQKFF
jgi:hypothetical protein